MATVVTTAQLQQVAQAQKSYIDAKDTALKTELSKSVSDETAAREAALQAQKTEIDKAIADGDKALSDKIEALKIPSEATEEDLADILDMFATGAAE